MNVLQSLLMDRLEVLGTGVCVWATSNEVMAWARRGSADRSEYFPAITELEEFWNLRNHLQRLEDGWAPTLADIRSFVTLTDWTPTADVFGDSGFAVVGTIAKDYSGFSAVAGETLLTMQVLAVDPQFRWILDRSGFFALDAYCEEGWSELASPEVDGIPDG